MVDQDLAGKIFGIEFNQPLLGVIVGVVSIVFASIYDIKELIFGSLFFSLIMALLSIVYTFHVVRRYWQRPKPTK